MEDGYKSLSNENESILELKNEIELLKLEKEELNRFFSLNLDLLCIANQEGNFLKLNKSWESILGYPLEELQNQKFFNLIHPEDLQSTNDALARLDASQPVLNFVNRYRHKNGTYKFLEWSGQQYGKFIYCTAKDITEQIEIHSKIQKNEESLRKAQSLSKIGSWEFDLISFELIWSDEHYKIFELEKQPSDKLYSAYRSKIHPDDISALDKVVNDAIESAANFVYEHRVICKDGSIKKVVGIGEVIKDNKNKPIKLHGTVQDITEREISEISLQKKEQQLRLALSGGNLGIWEWNFSTGKLEVDDRWMAILGLDNDHKPTIESWSSLVHPEDIGKLDILVQEVILNPFGTSFETEIRAMHKNGNYIWILDKGAVVERDKDGKPLYIIGTHMDITESKEAQRTLSLREKSLAAISQGVLLTDPNRKITYVNKAFEEITGYTEAEMLGQTCIMLQGKETDQATVLAIRAALQNHVPIQTEILNYAKDGKTFWNLLAISPVFDASGKLIQFVGVQKDITGRKQIEIELIQAKEQAEAANRAKSEFLANMSHEIRTPLNAIIGFTDLLTLSNLNDTEKQYLNIVFQSANSLLELLNDILDFSKIEAGKLELHLEKVDPYELLKQVTDILKFKALAKGIKVFLTSPVNIPHFIWTDPIRLRQIMINLLSNAVKFTNHGEIEIKVEVNDHNPHDNTSNLHFSVRDTGIGVSKENQEKIFEAFSQVDSSNNRKFRGTGLGLTISNDLLALMNSKLEVKSELGVGSIFYFSLSVKIEYAENIYMQPNSPENKTLLESKFKILLVDDDLLNLSLIKTIIRNILPNAILLEASNGREAVELFIKEQPDIIFIDIQMPEMNGHEATNTIRKLETNKKIPIIAVTAGVTDGNRDKCFACGMDDFTSKPVTKTKLKLLLQKWLVTKALQ